MTREQYIEKVDRLRRAARAYYDSDTLTMDDATYDELAAELAATELAHPDWVEVSVTVVGAGGATGGTVSHDTPMLSLDNVFDDQQLVEFCRRASEASGSDLWTVEPKLDGLAASATYQAGRLVMLATRGDGTQGESLLESNVDISGLPDQLSERVDLVVRGEIYMSDAQFEQANLTRAEAGESPLANPRNGAAGAMRARHGRYRLNVSFAAYGCPQLEEADQDEMLARLAQLGLATSAALVDTAGAAPAAEIPGLVARIQRRRAELGFPIDGAVVKAASGSARRALGETSRAPRWAVAYKFPPDSRLTRILSIDVTVGRTGVLTPVAALEPVAVGGATVTSATCSNPSEVVRKDLRVGDSVWVRRAGDVIPEIVAVNLPDRVEGAAAWQPPASCPRCSGAIEKDSRRWRCPNRSCGTAEAIEYFAGRDAMDIDGMGPAVVADLIAAGLVRDPADLYQLSAEQLTGLERFGTQRADNLLAEIERSRSQPLQRVICALGVRGTGRVISRRLARAFPSLALLRSASVEQLAGVEGIGSVKAAIIHAELSDLSDLVGRLEREGLGGTALDEPKEGPLSGRKVVVTGTVPGLTRTQATELVERLGGAATGSVSAGTDLLVVGAGAGASKLARAEALGVATITAEQLLALASGGDGGGDGPV